MTDKLDRNRLTRAANSGTGALTYTYGYDPRGNRTTDPAAGTLTYNGADQMSAQTGPNTSNYTYAGTDQNEMTTQTAPGGAVFTYRYGRPDQHGLPLLQSLTKDAQTIYLDHDALGTPQVLTTDTGNEAFYALDGLGTPVALIRTDGVTVAGYAYDPYGAYTTTTATGSAAAFNPYRHTGGLYDRGTSWLKHGQRWYDPTTGRFTQQDSIERLTDLTQGNRYTYAADNPTNYTDPTGRDCEAAIVEGSIGVASFFLGTAALIATPLTGGASTVLAIGAYFTTAAALPWAIDSFFDGCV